MGNQVTFSSLLPRIKLISPKSVVINHKKKLSVMKVEIWSDTMCPFCYIGKRRLEKALEQFPFKDGIEVIWKSFQLNPAMKTEPGKNINQYLSEIKGWSLAQAKQANDYVTSMAKEVGLTYDFDTRLLSLILLMLSGCYN